jgi:hypothetical protein
MTAIVHGRQFPCLVRGRPLIANPDAPNAILVRAKVGTLPHDRAEPYRPGTEGNTQEFLIKDPENDFEIYMEGGIATPALEADGAQDGSHSSSSSSLS